MLGKDSRQKNGKTEKQRADCVEDEQAPVTDKRGKHYVDEVRGLGGTENLGHVHDWKEPQKAAYEGDQIMHARLEF